MKGAIPSLKMEFRSLQDGIVWYDNYTKYALMKGGYNDYWVEINGKIYESWNGESERDFKFRLESELN